MEKTAYATGLTTDESFVLDHWSRWGSDGYPIVKRGRKWFIDGMCGLGKFPIAFKTKRESAEYWERFIDILIARKAGRL